MEQIPNPFKEAWLEFDKEEYKKDIGKMIDSIIENGGRDEEEIDELGDAIGYILLLLKFKDKEYMDVVKSSDLPEDIIHDLGLNDEDIADIIDDETYIPLMLITKYIDPDRLKDLEKQGIIEIEKKNQLGIKKSKNGKDMWLI
jgi:rhamnogalacturonyl hydrolase YesR